MEKMPSREKFNLDDISELMIRLLSDDSLDEKSKEVVITEFLKSRGYSPIQDAVTKLSKSFQGEISFETFKNRLEESADVH